MTAPWMRTDRVQRHPVDPACQGSHPVAGPGAPHGHEIIEDWTHEHKQAVGAHIDRWHFPVSPKRES